MPNDTLGPLVEWWEPDTEGNPVQVRCTVEDAIARSKAVAERRGFVHANDADALSDFLTVHWAWVVE